METAQAFGLVKRQMAYRPGENAPKIERPALVRVLTDHEKAVKERNDFETEWTHCKAGWDKAEQEIKELTKERNELQVERAKLVAINDQLNVGLAQAQDQINKMSADQEHVVKVLKGTIDEQAAVIKGLQADMKRWSEPRAQE